MWPCPVVCCLWLWFMCNFLFSSLSIVTQPKQKFLILFLFHSWTEVLSKLHTLVNASYIDKKPPQLVYHLWACICGSLCQWCMYSQWLHQSTVQSIMGRYPSVQHATVGHIVFWKVLSMHGGAEKSCTRLAGSQVSTSQYATVSIP